MNLLHLDLEVRLKGSEIQSFKKQETTGSLSMLRGWSLTNIKQKSWNLSFIIKQNKTTHNDNNKTSSNHNLNGFGREP